jgi:hypothetical protein
MIFFFGVPPSLVTHLSLWLALLLVLCARPYGAVEGIKVDSPASSLGGA